MGSGRAWGGKKGFRELLEAHSKLEATGSALREEIVDVVVDIAVGEVSVGVRLIGKNIG